jgi:Na+/alanine symporter
MVLKKAEKFKNLKTFACMDLGLGKLHRLQIIIVGSAAYWHLFVSLCAIMKLKMVWNLDNLVGFLNFIFNNCTILDLEPPAMEAVHATYCGEQSLVVRSRIPSQT